MAAVTLHTNLLGTAKCTVLSLSSGLTHGHR